MCYRRVYGRAENKVGVALWFQTSASLFAVFSSAAVVGALLGRPLPLPLPLPSHRPLSAALSSSLGPPARLRLAALRASTTTLTRAPKSLSTCDWLRSTAAL